MPVENIESHLPKSRLLKNFIVGNSQPFHGPLEQGRSRTEYQNDCSLLHVRGVGGTPKNVALKRLCIVVNPDIIMIQETMYIISKTEDIFSS